MAQNRLTMTFLFCSPYDIIIWAGQVIVINRLINFISYAIGIVSGLFLKIQKRYKIKFQLTITAIDPNRTIK